MIGTVTNDAPFTVRIRGSERENLVWLSGYQPAIGDRVLLLQKGSEPPIVVGKLGGSSGIGAPVAPFQPFASMELYGHSGVWGGASTGMTGTDGKLGALLGANSINRAKGGARLAWSEPSTGEVGGWAHVYRYIAPPVTGGAETNKYMLANRDLVVLWFGNNDLAQLGPGADFEPATVALEACISRARAAMIFEEDHSTVTYPTGSWARYGAGTVERGGNLLYASGGYYQSAASGSVKVTTPSDFQGGVVTLAFIVANDGSGAAMDFTYDGAAAGSLDTRNKNAHDYGTSVSSGTNRHPNTVVKRFLCAAGSHEIVATRTAGSFIAFDCWWPEAAVPPLVVVVGGWETDDSVPLFEFYDLGGFPYVPVAGDIAAMDAQIEAVCDTFDTNVLFVPVNAALARNRKNFSTDHIHPSDRGHAIVAEQIAVAVAGASRSRRAHAEGAGDPPFVTTTPNTADRNVIEAGQTDTVPLTLRGRRPGDQTHALLRLDGAGSYPVIEYGRDLPVVTDARIGVADAAGQIIGDAAAADLVTRSDTGDVRITAGTATTGLLVTDAMVSSPLGFKWDSGTHSASIGPLAGAASIGFDADVAIYRTAADEITLAAGDHLKTDDPTAAQHVATKAYVDHNLGTWFAVPNIGNYAAQAPTANRVYYAQVVVPVPATLTGISFLMVTIGTGVNVRSALYDATGARVANRTTNLACAALTTHQVAFDSTYAAAPGVYFVALVFGAAQGTFAGSNALSPCYYVAGPGSGATATSITPPTTAGQTPPAMTTY